MMKEEKSKSLLLGGGEVAPAETAAACRSGTGWWAESRPEISGRLRERKALRYTPPEFR